MISNSEFNQKLLEKIGETYPKKSQQLEFLMVKMSLGKESAYRRLRGDVPFSFTEACMIANILGFSLDSIVRNGYSKSSPIFQLHATPPVEHQQVDYNNYYSQIYHIYDILIEKWSVDPNLKIYSASNIIPQAMMFPYPYLSKFRAFAWKYQMDYSLIPHKFSEIKLSQELSKKQQELLTKIRRFPENTFIISRNIFDTIVRMIHYFFNLSYITSQEVSILQDELLSLVNRLEYLTTIDRTSSDGRVWIYLANIDFDSNYTYVEGSSYKRSFIELYFINTISSSDAQICSIHKTWIDSLKKYSTLISMSGEIERTAFFERQRELIGSLSKLTPQVVKFNQLSK